LSTASFRPQIKSDITFDFVDGPISVSPGADIQLFFGPPYLAFWNDTFDVESIRTAHKWLLDLIDRRGPYDGVLMFSQGCSLVSSFLMYHQCERPNEPLPFKAAVFVCGGVPFKVLDDLGFPASQAAHAIEQRSRDQLQEKVSAITTIEAGVDRWDQPSSNGEKPNVSSSSFDPDNPTNLHDVFGLDFTNLPSHLLIRDLPTVHIYGSKDPRYPASIQLTQFFDPKLRQVYDHKGGHDIPRTSQVSTRVAELMDWVVSMASRG
jgi:hypothetical protein